MRQLRYALSRVLREVGLPLSWFLVSVVAILWMFSLVPGAEQSWVAWVPRLVSQTLSQVVNQAVELRDAVWNKLTSTTLLQFFQLAGALGAMVALLTLTYTARTYRLSYRGQVTERLTKALERLGSDEPWVASRSWRVFCTSPPNITKW